MSGKPQRRSRQAPDPNPERQAARSARLRMFVSGMYWLAAVCLLGLALVVLADADTPVLRWVFMGGIALAGSAIIILQAQQECPHCGASYGYYPRLIKSNVCRRCGGEFPRWSPGGRT